MEFRHRSGPRPRPRTGDHQCISEMASSSSEDIFCLRQEYLCLQRHLQAGQQKLRNSVELLKTASYTTTSKPRLTKRYHTRTSTPKVSARKDCGRVLCKRDTSNRKTSHHRQLGRFQSNSDLKTPHRASQRSSPRISLVSSTESEELSTLSEAIQSQNNSDNSHLSLNTSENSRCKSPSKYLRSARKGSSVRIGNTRDRGAVYSSQELSSDVSPTYTETIEDSTHLPKSILITPGIKQRGKTPNRVAFVKRLNQSSAKKTDILTKGRSLLGYDWIAGVLESESQQAAQSDQFFDEICQFRRTHRGQCVHESVSDVGLDLQTDSSVQEPSEVTDDIGADARSSYLHKCVHNYTVNERLFPVPLNEARNGESLCAICRSRKDPAATKTSPAYIRVSIPRSTLVSPYRVRSRRRRSFDPTESLGLSKHCLSGWQCSKPSMMPAASSLDIKSSLPSTALRSTASSLDIKSSRRISNHVKPARTPLTKSREESRYAHHQKK